MKSTFLFIYLFIAFVVFSISLIDWFVVNLGKKYPFSKVVCYTTFWPFYAAKFFIPKVLYLIDDVLNTFIDDMVGEYL